jgi:hypothetical protein
MVGETENVRLDEVSAGITRVGATLKRSGRVISVRQYWGFLA